MTQYGIAVETGQHRVYATDNGIDKRLVGPRWASVREAIRYSNLCAELDARPVSPLRSPVERSTPDSAGALGLGTESGDEVGTLDGSPAAVIPPASGRA